MKTIARFQVPEEAHLFRSFLETRGIPAFVFDEHTVQLCWFYSNAIGGVRVVVDDPNLEEAVKGYRDYSGSLHDNPPPVTVVRTGALAFLLSLVLGVPTLLFGRRRVREARRPHAGQP